jgi:hypothetical protein
MQHIVNSNHDWKKMRLNLDNNICLVALKYTNPTNIKIHNVLGNDIKVLNTSIHVNCLYNQCSNKVGCIKTIHYNSKDNNMGTFVQL